MEYKTHQIFPHFEFIQDGEEWVYVTNVRIFDEETTCMYVATYWQKANPNFVFPGTKPITKDILLQNAVFGAYKLLLFGNINEKSVFRRDDNFQKERDRLYNLTKLGL